ncbi:MAG: hypothetical protein MJ193_04325, partial [Clostridia bacterium]|nr:hypothetical protein [Clostridia bacterium]
KYIRAALAALENVKDAAEKRVYLEKVAALSRVSADALIKEYGKVVKAKPAVAPKEIEEKEEKTLKAERFILNKIINKAPYANTAFFDVNWMLHPVHKSIAEYVLSSGNNANFATLFDMFPAEKEVNKIIECGDVYESAVGAMLKFENSQKEEEYYLDCLNAVANEYISSRLELVKQQYSQASSQDEKRALLNELKNLQTKLKSKNITDKM